MCGDQEVITVTGGIREPDVLALNTNDALRKGFKDGAICRYKLEFPTDAAAEDQIAVTLGSIANAIVYVTETSSFDSSMPT